MLKERWSWRNAVRDVVENIFAPGQYSRNVITNPNSSDSVEFVINLPGHDENREHVMLPIDAKYPMDIYEECLMLMIQQIWKG